MSRKVSIAKRIGAGIFLVIVVGYFIPERLVVFQGKNKLGGNIVLVLGPKWRLHYYAHMESSIASFGDFVSRGEAIGAVGNSGNAAGKKSHLHYVILSVIPYPWRIDTATQGWKKMFYLDPNTKLRADLGI